MNLGIKEKTMLAADLRFKDNRSVAGREARYRTVFVSVEAVLKSWRSSLFSFEWLNGDGGIKTLDQLSILDRDKRLAVEKSLSAGVVLERPVLGIGLLDHVEIGAGRDVFLTLAAHGAKTVEVHIPASNLKDFKTMIAA